MALALRSGFAGAAAVTALHQLAKYSTPKAPRMDTLGRRGLARVMRASGLKPPRGDRLQAAALLADLASNSLYYALIGRSRRPVLRGALLGALAGWGAVSAPPKLGLGWLPSRKTRDTKRMAFALYLLGGLAAGLYARRRAAAVSL
jgi:hypothetical protein